MAGCLSELDVKYYLQQVKELKCGCGAGQGHVQEVGQLVCAYIKLLKVRGRCHTRQVCLLLSVCLGAPHR